jgi:hypothetical protein
MNTPNDVVVISNRLSPAHLQVLGVCIEYPKSGDGAFCGEWIMHACEKQGVPFHQAWLTKLANVGLLEKEDTSRGGHRRYYKLKNVELAQAVLNQAVSEMAR